MQWDREILETLVRDVACDEAAECATRHEISLCSEKSEQARQRLERKDLAAAHAAPQSR
jgi:hypothetical protein